MKNKRLEELCKNIDVSQNEREANMYRKWGVDSCKAPTGCESVQYGCRSWKCLYDGSKSTWCNDAKVRYGTKRKGI